jgi:DNA-binding MarR family transcriptional regulator
MEATPTRADLLGELGERIIDAFRYLQGDVTVPREGLVHVTRSEADIMRVLMESPGTTVTEIARTFGQHKSNTSTRIAALVEKGLAEKASAADDGREVRVYATQAAIDNLARYRKVWAAHLAPLTTADDARLAVAVDVLTELADALAAESWPASETAETGPSTVRTK